jgi:hypothetical protein
VGQCFVIQPFDNGRFDKRYEDVFAPAIRQAGLEPYRVDRDPGSSVPIEDIEAGIRTSEACLADITLDNPNVWYELGFAMAYKKPVILVSSTERSERFPFDIQHRQVITYATESPRDFDALRDDIAKRLQARVEGQHRLQSLAAISPIQETEGLLPHEMAALISLAEGESGPYSGTSAWSLHRKMESAGFTKIAANLSLASLVRKGFVEQATLRDDRDNEYDGYRVTDSGFGWLNANQSRIVLRHNAPQGQGLDDDIPF